MQITDLNFTIQDIERNLPEFLRAIDLIKCGLYKSRSDISWSLKRGLAPPAIKLSPHKIVFPRASLCIWLREKAQINIPGAKKGECAINESYN